MRRKIASMIASAPKKRTTKLTRAKLLEGRRRKGRPGATDYRGRPENTERKLTRRLIEAAHREARQWGYNNATYWYAKGL